MASEQDTKQDVWDGDEYLSRPGMREQAKVNGEENIPAGLVAAGIPASKFGELDVLEVGAGVGTVTLHLADRFRSVYAVEPSAGMLATFAKIVDRPNVQHALHMVTPASAAEFAKGTPLPSPTTADPDRKAPAPHAQFDAAISTIVVHHVDEFGPFFEGVKSVLKPGGVFVAVDFTFGPDGKDLSKQGHLEKEPTMVPVSDDEQKLTDPMQFRTSYTIESLGDLFRKYGFVDVGGVHTTTVRPFGNAFSVPTIAVFGRRPL